MLDHFKAKIQSFDYKLHHVFNTRKTQYRK